MKISKALTKREIEVLELMALGMTNAEIAERLVISHSTVKTHVENILRKLGARNRTEAVVLRASPRHQDPGSWPSADGS